jgi:hypothetical protein
VLSNSTENIGGGLCAVRTLTIISSVVQHNSTRTAVRQPYYGGGGIWAKGAVVSIRNTQISSNRATRRGGGLALEKGVLTLTNSIVADNAAETLGSGLYVEDMSADLVHTTIARNQGGDGSGIHITGISSTVGMTNTILVSHTVGITVTAGNTAALEATLWGTDTWANRADWGGSGTILTGTINLWGDPDFVDPDAGDYHIDADSAAIDAGVDAGVRQDIDGDPRPAGYCYDGDGYPRPMQECYDIGADEFPARMIYLPLVMYGSSPTVRR